MNLIYYAINTREEERKEGRKEGSENFEAFRWKS